MVGHEPLELSILVRIQVRQQNLEHLQTFEIILPNLIHKSEKRNLHIAQVSELC